MSLSQRVLQVWATSQYLAPRVPLIFYENEYMATVDDSGIFFRFMSTDGSIFVALNRNCQANTAPATVGDTVYVCTKVDPILCSPSTGPESIRDIFVLNHIVPLLA